MYVHTLLLRLYEVFGARSRYFGQGQVIASHKILPDAIIYPCLKTPAFSADVLVRQI